MSDPTKQPGFQFIGMRVIRAHCEIVGDPPPGASGSLEVSYSDNVAVEDQSVTVRQTIQVQIFDPTNRDIVFLRSLVEIEGRFQGAADANIAPNEFGDNYAPTILYPFAREWIHKLTSAALPWPPILLPPVNVPELRKQARAAAGSPSHASARKPKSKSRR